MWKFCCSNNCCDKEEKEDTYKCEVCGAVSKEKGECCGKPKERLCSCGSGELEKNCCAQ